MDILNISSFIWGIADDVLRDVYVRGKYRDVILPMTVIRRLDAVLEPTKKAVLDVMKAQLDAAGITNQDGPLRLAAGQAFYNTSPFPPTGPDFAGRSNSSYAMTSGPTSTASRPTFRRCWRSSGSATRFPRWWRRMPWATCWKSSWTVRSISAPNPS